MAGELLPFPGRLDVRWHQINSWIQEQMYQVTWDVFICVCSVWVPMRDDRYIRVFECMMEWNSGEYGDVTTVECKHKSTLYFLSRYVNWFYIDVSSVQNLITWLIWYWGWLANFKIRCGKTKVTPRCDAKQRVFWKIECGSRMISVMCWKLDQSGITHNQTKPEAFDLICTSPWEDMILIVMLCKSLSHIENWQRSWKMCSKDVVRDHTRCVTMKFKSLYIYIYIASY